MSNSTSKRLVEKVVLSVILECILSFIIAGWQPFTITLPERYPYAEAAAAAADNENLSLFTNSTTANPEDTIKKNDTKKTIDFNDKINASNAAPNYSNSLVSRNKFINETSPQLSALVCVGRDRGQVTADFNGDGFDDKAIGIPNEDVLNRFLNKTKFDAGAVQVIYGSSHGLDATAANLHDIFLSDGFTPPVEESDCYGTSVSAGDYDGDGFDDLAIGTPGEELGFAGVEDAGVVHVFYGSSVGLRPGVFGNEYQRIFKGYFGSDYGGLSGIPQVGDAAGTFLSSGDYNGDGKDDLAVGVPGEDVGSHRNAGAFHVIYGSTNGLSPTAVVPEQVWTLSPGVAEAWYGAGNVLSSGDYNGDGKDDISLGVPGAAINGKPSVGIVQVIYGSSAGLSSSTPRPIQLWTQNSTGIQDIAESLDSFGWSLSSGDYNGDGKDDLAIGADGESINGETIPRVGKVHTIYGSPSGLSASSPIANQLWMQGANNILGEAEADDLFGSSLSSGDYNGDGKDDLAIGSNREDIDTAAGSAINAGAVNVIYGSSAGLSPTSPIANQLWMQGANNVWGIPDFNEEFGSSLSSGDYNNDGRDDLAIGIPGEDFPGGAVDAGAMEVLQGSASGLFAGTLFDQIWFQGTKGLFETPEFNDQFASVQ